MRGMAGPIYVNFVEFQKAFDSVFRAKLWVIMQENDIPRPGMYINIIRYLYDKSSSYILEGMLREHQTGLTCEVA